MASTSVVIKGPAIRAGSTLSFFASNGRVPPTILAIITVTTKVKDTVKATVGSTVTIYEIVPEAGVRISKIKNLEDDIAL